MMLFVWVVVPDPVAEEEETMGSLDDKEKKRNPKELT